MQKLLTVVAFQDQILRHSLYVCIGCTSRASHRCNHQDGLFRYTARDALNISFGKTCLFRETRTRLEHINASAQVSLRQTDQFINHLFRLQIDPLSLANTQEALLLRLERDRSEPELDASRSERVNDLADVVANDAEACRVAVCLDYAPQRSLCVIGHGVSLVEDHELELRHIASVGMPSNLALCELLHLLSHHYDAALITGVELKHPLTVEIWSEKVLCKRQNCRCFASARWSIHEQVWHLAALDRAFKGLNHFHLMTDVLDATRSVLFNPWHVSWLTGRRIKHGHVCWRGLSLRSRRLIISSSFL